MRPSAEVLVIGDALLDVSVAPSAPMRSGGDVPASVHVAPGGQGANVAVRMARRGVRVRLACALGDDAAGHLVREALAVERVELDIADAPATGAVVIVVDADGERTMLSQRVPMLPQTVEAAAWTVISGYVLLEEGELDLRGRKRLAILGCSVPDRDVDGWRQRVEAARPDVTILNTDEVSALGSDAAALAMDFGRVVVTGADGAIVTSADRGGAPRHVSAARVPAVDTTGAGDAFAAAFVAELHDRRDWHDADVDRALAAGLELAAHVAQVVGAQTVVPPERREEGA